ncbi:MAG: tRNA threonylcarbamoyladenosine dehydratase, partial [Eggerthellaceae bacterium]|nr:tRNA threonylcarbamoyladenosine dehydratase [Eggerthellaceae bacterium]
MDQAFSRTALLLGAEAMEKLRASRVIVFGLGGVGGHACEALVRSGVGAIDLVDDDQVSESNLNRQLFATRSTIGMDKTEAAKARLLDINPDLKVTTHKCFFLPETADRFDFTQYDYIVDAIDTVTGKIALAEAADRAGTPIISSMGAGNKLDPTAFEVTDINKTSVCPLARIMRKELRKRGEKKLKVGYSREDAMTPLEP